MFKIDLGQEIKIKKINLFRATTKSHNIDLKKDFKLDKILPGKGYILKKGKDLTIISTGHNLKIAMDSIPELKDKGIEPEIIYLPTIKPLDEKLILKSVKKTKKFIVMEHQSQYGGLFSDISSLIIRKNKTQSVRGNDISFRNNYIHEYGSFDQHNKRLGFSTKGIIKSFKELTKK